MNHIYHSIWNDALGAWVAVSEIATGQGKRSTNRRKNKMTASPLKDWQSSTPLLATSLLLCSSAAWALPTGDQLVAGQATVNTPSAGKMQINQASQQAIINWQGFSIAPTEAVNIQQPNAQAALLNRVVGADASQIQGQLNANGQVYLVNPNGVIFGKTAQVDVGGLIASTHDISNADFIAGKNHFTQNGATGTVENHGTINVPNGGVVALISTSVTNTGNINTPNGTTALAAGKTVDLDFQGNGLVEVKVSEAALNAQITNKGAIQADGGRVVLTAKAAGQLIDTVINQDGIIKAQGLVQRNGEIILEGGLVSQTGTLDASGKTGGNININARAILDAGKTNADGTKGAGGNINMVASDAIIQTAAANAHANGTTTGGTVHLESTNSTYSSGTLSATGGQQGGTVDVVSSGDVTLAAANVNASGGNQGGLIRVGGDFHGANAKLPNAKTTTINGATTLKADGGKGQVVVWSNKQTDYYGSISANQKGDIEVSSKGTLNYAGTADAGVGGQLLLDPANIVISATGSVAAYALIDPHKAANNNFGSNTTLLGTTVNKVFTSNGNMVVTSPKDSFVAASAGAVYLFNTTTGALISALTGAQTNDKVGFGGITALSNGNYVVGSYRWANGTATAAGAVTWGNGLTGITGAVSSSNSLVGTQTNDFVGSNSITALSNGNYVVASNNWANGTATNAGAVTWGNGSTGITGAVSSSNSLVGKTNDQVGNYGITALSNGNYVVDSRNWANGTATWAGAVTWGNGLTGITGAVSSSNSLVGTQTNDLVGNYGITALSNGNYVVDSSFWANGTATEAGAVTWGNGLTGITGAVSSSNSLVGSQSGDNVGIYGITALSNGNYVVDSSFWTNGTAQVAGAVTWGNGLTGITGAVSSSNSLVGTQSTDYVGIGGIRALSNGNYVVGSSWWANGTVTKAGAATWGNGLTGITGAVSSSNSLVGSQSDDNVGSSGITALSNGNYVVGSLYWANGTATGAAGAATWGNGLTGITGAVSSSNSLVGSQSGDSVGIGGITALSNGNYVVGSNWANGTATNAGAVTWGNGLTGITGAVSSSNSLVGSQSGDNVGSTGITALSNGNYVVSSYNWANGTATYAGAATWGNGLTGITGAVSSSNSLVGTQTNDRVGAGGFTALSNGNYVVASRNWANGTATRAGAVTWGNGSTGFTGAVSSSNSLVGTQANDLVGNGGITDLQNGNYAVASAYQSNGGLANAGQVQIVTPQNIYFNNGLGQTMTFNPSMLNNTLAAGTNVILQASNDITVNAAINVAGSSGGALSLQAGRNINLNAGISTANGNFTAVAGDPNAVAADRSAGTPTITLGSGATINAGTGKVILAAINGNFVNNSGSTAPITASQWLVYSTDPRLNSRNGMLASAKHYGQTYTDGVTPSYVTSGSGNWFLYSITPVLTVTPNNVSIVANTNVDPAQFFSPTITGFIDGDTLGTAGIGGRAVYGIGNYTGNVGSYDVAYLRGLASTLGYTFVDNTASINELTVTPSAPVIPVVPSVPVIPVVLVEQEHSTQVNIFNLNLFSSQIAPLQASTLFLNWYNSISTNNSDYVDSDFGQYKGDAYSLNTVGSEWRSEHGKQHWHEKQHGNKKKNLYATLLYILENNGIKLPAGLLANLKF